MSRPDPTLQERINGEVANGIAMAAEREQFMRDHDGRDQIEQMAFEYPVFRRALTTMNKVDPLADWIKRTGKALPTA